MQRLVGALKPIVTDQPTAASAKRPTKPLKGTVKSNEVFNWRITLLALAGVLCTSFTAFALFILLYEGAATRKVDLGVTALERTSR